MSLEDIHLHNGPVGDENGRVLNLTGILWRLDQAGRDPIVTVIAPRPSAERSCVLGCRPVKRGFLSHEGRSPLFVVLR